MLLVILVLLVVIVINIIVGTGKETAEDIQMEFDIVETVMELELNVANPSSTCNAFANDALIEDIDDDNQNELLVLVSDLTSNDASYVVEYLSSAMFYLPSGGRLVAEDLDIADVDGDGRKEVVVVGWNISAGCMVTSPSSEMFLFIVEFDGNTWSLERTFRYTGNYKPYHIFIEGGNCVITGELEGYDVMIIDCRSGSIVREEDITSDIARNTVKLGNYYLTNHFNDKEGCVTRWGGGSTTKVCFLFPQTPTLTPQFDDVYMARKSMTKIGNEVAVSFRYSLTDPNTGRKEYRVAAVFLDASLRPVYNYFPDGFKSGEPLVAGEPIALGKYVAIPVVELVPGGTGYLSIFRSDTKELFFLGKLVYRLLIYGDGGGDITGDGDPEIPVVFARYENTLRPFGIVVSATKGGLIKEMWRIYSTKRDRVI